jgi:tetratricopeptide (TPR) repeat protein
MDNSIQNALKNLVEKQATSDELELIRQALASGQIFIGGSAHNSVIIVGSGNSVQLSPEILERLAAASYLSALHQLPQPPADFVGRNKELRKILTGIEKASGAAISGLTGMPGIGKTTLGLVVAHDLVDKYSDAQFFINLRGTSKDPLKPLDVMKHIIHSFYPTEDLRNATADELAGKYQSALAEKRAVIFLDNAHDASQVSPLLPPSNCFMLVTSRFHFTVSGLQTIKLDILKEKDAVKLITGICSRIINKDAQRIAALCGYLPIALRLAASYLEIHTDWTTEEYINQLSDKAKRLQALQLEGADASIEALFEQSYQQLSNDEQRFWNMLVVFPASFKRDALVSVWNLNNAATRKVAGKLCQYSLLEYDPITTRYHLHDLLADFAYTKIEYPDRTLALLNYFRHYRDVWHTAEELYTKGGKDATRGILLFDAENIHIKTAYGWAIENIDSNKEIPTILKEIPNSVFLTRIRLHPNEQIKWFSAIFDAALKYGDMNNQNKALGNIGTAYAHLGENRKAIEYWERALKIAHEIGDKQRQGAWLGNLGNAYANLNDGHKAIEYYKRALEIAYEVGDKSRQGGWLGNIGIVYSELGEEQKAIEYFERALEIARETNDQQQECIWLIDIGNAYSIMSESRKAIDYADQAFRIAHKNGDLEQEGTCLGNIGVGYSGLGKYHNAINYYEQALEIFREIGDRRQESIWLCNIGYAYCVLDENLKAIEYANKSLVIAREVGSRQQESVCLGNIGIAYVNLGDNRQAIEYYGQALEIARQIGDRQFECALHNRFGELYVKLNDPGRARESLERSLSISKELRLRDAEGKSLFNFAKLSQLEDNKESTLEYAQNARAIFESIESPELEKVNQFIESLKE